MERELYIALHTGQSWHHADIKAYHRYTDCVIGKNTKCRRRNTDSKIINIANSNRSNKWLLGVALAALVNYNYQAAKTRALYEFADRPAGQHADNPPNSDMLWNSIQQYPNWRLGFIDNPDSHFGVGLVLTRTRTQSNGPELFLILGLCS